MRFENPSISKPSSSVSGTCSATLKSGRGVSKRSTSSSCSRPLLWPKAAACASSNRSCQRARGDITVWDAPSYFEFRQKSGGISNVAGHRVEALEEGGSRLTLSLEMNGLLIPVIALFYKGRTNRYMVHPSRDRDERGIAVPGIRIVTPLALEALKLAVRSYAVALADGQGRWGEEQAVAEQLAHHKLDAGNVLQTYADSAQAATAAT